VFDHRLKVAYCSTTLCEAKKINLTATSCYCSPNPEAARSTSSPGKAKKKQTLSIELRFNLLVYRLKSSGRFSLPDFGGDHLVSYLDLVVLPDFNLFAESSREVAHVD